MKTLTYILATLLVIWGLFIVVIKLFFTGAHFPFLTVLTIGAIISGIMKHPKADWAFFTIGCLWIVFGAETMGFALFFDEGNYQRMTLGLIPFLMGGGILFSRPFEVPLFNTPAKKLLLVPVLMGMGLGSYVHKVTTSTVNCWYYLDQGEDFNVLFAEVPGRTFEVRLSSKELKQVVSKEAIQYEGHEGYYCPETEIRVVTSFGNLTSAEIIAFRNSQIDKKVIFSQPEAIPLDKAVGTIDILKPYTPPLWN